MADGLALTTVLTGGLGGTPVQNGENGTIWSTPCAPGYFGLLCTPCLPGYYKSEYSNVDCKACQSMPVAAQEEGTAEYTNWA